MQRKFGLSHVTSKKNPRVVYITLLQSCQTSPVIIKSKLCGEKSNYFENKTITHVLVSVIYIFVALSNNKFSCNRSP